MADLITRLRGLRAEIAKHMPTEADSEYNDGVGWAISVALAQMTAAGFTADGCEAADEIERLSQPEFWWPASWPEDVFTSPRDVIDELNPGEIEQCSLGRSLGKTVWLAWRCLTVDADGEPDETDVAEFDTMDEAARCWSESLTACRATLEQKP